ncbi:TPA_asm: P6 [Zea alphacytorhabdovirus 1]|nr:TPA_asm: P6 [Zea alphacytorhabdovirus 1]
MHWHDFIPDLNAEDFTFDIPGYDYDRRDLVIFVLALLKALLIIALIIVCKSRRKSGSKLHMKWV